MPSFTECSLPTHAGCITIQSLERVFCQSEDHRIVAAADDAIIKNLTVSLPSITFGVAYSDIKVEPLSETSVSLTLAHAVGTTINITTATFTEFPVIPVPSQCIALGLSISNADSTDCENGGRNCVYLFLSNQRDACTPFKCFLE